MRSSLGSFPFIISSLLSQIRNGRSDILARALGYLGGASFIQFLRYTIPGQVFFSRSHFTDEDGGHPSDYIISHQFWNSNDRGKSLFTTNGVNKRGRDMNRMGDGG